MSFSLTLFISLCLLLQVTSQNSEDELNNLMKQIENVSKENTKELSALKSQIAELLQTYKEKQLEERNRFNDIFKSIETLKDITKYNAESSKFSFGIYEKIIVFVLSADLVILIIILIHNKSKKSICNNDNEKNKETNPIKEN